MLIPNRNLLVLVPFVTALTAASALAQVRVVPVVGGGSFFYRPSIYSGFSNPALAGYRTGYAGYSGALLNNAYSYPQLGTGYSSAYWQGAYSGPVYYPGWWAGSSNTPRMRSRLDPAVRIPSSKSKNVSLASDSPGQTVARTHKPAATLEVVLPCPDARVWVQGAATTQTGKVRHYVTPDLQPGRHYQYSVKATWNTETGPCERVQTVRVLPGCRKRLDFCR